MSISAKNILVFCALAGVLASCSNSVEAHGGGFQLSKRADAGPYSLTMGTIPDPPTVGEAIFILEVTRLGDSERIVGLSVSIAPSAPEGMRRKRRHAIWSPRLIRPDALRNARGVAKPRPMDVRCND